MSADAITNPPTTESKTARKKRAKAEAEAATKADVTPAASTPAEEQGEPLANGESQGESAFVKELQKNIRNVNKKLNAMTRLDAILAENKGVSLDDLVASRKINNDQREQALRKPGLQSSLTQLEEQITQYKKVDADYKGRMASQHESLTSAHKSEIEALKVQLQKEAEEKSKTELRKKLLTFSQFLRAAAAKRVIEEEADTEESRGFEGVLLLVYGGDEKAVDAAEKLIEGADEPVPSVEGTLLSTTYSHIKTASLSHAPFPDESEIPTTESTAEGQPAPFQPEETAPSSDPTVAHAGLTELGLNQPIGVPAVEEFGDGAIKEAAIDDTHANLAGDRWDNNTTAGGINPEENLDESFEMVPRNPSETEAPHEKAQQGSTNSWADDATAAAVAQTTPAARTNGAGDDGFHEVERRGGRGGHRAQGEGRGRGGRGRGGFRGEGKGEGRGGRGRGGFRADGQRGGRGRGPRGASGQAAASAAPAAPAPAPAPAATSS